MNIFSSPPVYISKLRLDRGIARCQMVLHNDRSLYLFKAFFYFIYYTGIYKREFKSLTWDKIDLERNRAFLSNRIIYFPDKVKNLLVSYRQVFPNEERFLDLNEYDIEHIFGALNRGVPRNKRISIENMRTSFFVMCVKKRVPMEIMMKLMGALSPFVPYWYYYHCAKITDEMVEKIYKKKIK